MPTIWKKFVQRNGSRGEQGQDLSEYALLIGLIAMVVLVAVSLLGTNLSAIYEYFSDVIASIAPG